MERVETTILNNLLFNEEYTRKVLPFLRPEYFEEKCDTLVFEQISSFLTQYDKLPTKEVLNIELQKRVDLSQDEYSLVTLSLIHISEPTRPY